MDIKDMLLGAEHYFKTKNGNYVELRVDSEPYVDSDTDDVAYGKSILIDLHHETEKDALKQMVHNLSDKVRSALDKMVYDDFMEKMKSSSVKEEIYGEDETDTSYCYYLCDENDKYLWTFEEEFETSQEITNEFKNNILQDYYERDYFDNLDVEEYLRSADDPSILQYDFIPDCVMQCYETLVYTENTNLDIDEQTFSEQAEYTSHFVDAVENFGIYFGTLYDKNGNELETYNGLPEDVLADLFYGSDDELLEEIDELPNFDEMNRDEEER